MKKSILILLAALLCGPACAQFTIEDGRPCFSLGGEAVVTIPTEGLWSVATAWENDWPAAWIHADASEVEISGEWAMLKGRITLDGGELHLRDSYRTLDNGLVQCIRRYEWHGQDTLRKATLSVRLRMAGERLMPLLPGILYYGNSMGAKVNSAVIPVYTGSPCEFAIFEDHRYPIPFAMLEDAASMRAAAVHTTPSPVRGAVLGDQWWSMGVEACDGYTDFVLYSGPIGYNGTRSVAKARQFEPMRYSDTYINMEPGRVIEKEFFVELYPIDRKGSGFQRPVYTALDQYRPCDADRFPGLDAILDGKYRFALSRWIDEGGAAGFGMYDLGSAKDLVMGWCGQADSPGYALQVLEEKLADPAIPAMVQRSMDFLSTYPVGKDGMFPVGYNVSEKRFHGGDHVSCGQAMFNFAKAVEAARKNGKYDTAEWERFLRKACDGQSARILAPEWNPYSTAEAFYIAPLAIAGELFGNKDYKKAAVKAGETMAARHLTMEGCYWGGTLDATCEDKEGAWAAFQGFLALYEHYGNREYLDWAKHAMDVVLSYTVVWDIPLPAGRMADHGFKSTGWTVVSPQNQHIDVYGVMFTPDIYRMGVHLGDDRLKEIAKVMYRSCYQLTDARGSQGEQLQQTNFAQQGDMSNVHKLRGGYSESWTVFWITAHFLNAAARFEDMGVEL